MNSVVIVICTMMYLALIFFLTACIQNTIGHGYMYHPSPWHNTNNCSAEGSVFDCQFYLKFPLPDERCFDDESDEHRGCASPRIQRTDW